ncbi:type IX secretion system protein PorG [Taibaiella soli]|uniref:DUF6089 domain-containing protein n=1 Tax=Taibaiella soli TaxID=1649169 RepID=A0A2W2AIK3_9BACT|nr:DUF6089 family protein [Taibaiella soli]PZF72070.1 hypothetical protein DN068_14115 [Taibaiella soli]
MSKKIAVLLSLLIVSFTGAQAQSFYKASEWGIIFGGSEYFGDINDHYGFDYVRPALGVFARLHLNPYISVRGNLSYTKVGYDDKYSSNPFNQKRNLSFRSDIFEASVQTEFNFFRFATGEDNSRFTPYLTGGVGVFYYNPYTDYDGRKYYLRTLGTEGQFADHPERRYSTFSMCFPIGMGFKYWIRPGLNFGFEIADRLTLTDYLDDVSTTYVGADKFPNDPQNPNPAYILQDRSMEINPNDPLGRAGKQRGNSSSKDQYMYFVFNISFQLKTYKCPGYMRRGFSDF